MKKKAKSRVIIPKPGTSTGNQAPKQGNGGGVLMHRGAGDFGPGAGYGGSGMEGWSAPRAGDYELYREISSHPAVTEVMSIFRAPITTNGWTWVTQATSRQGRQRKAPAGEVTAHGVPQEIVDFCRSTLDPLIPALVEDCLRAMEFGCAKFEKIWSNDGRRLILEELKPLAFDPEQTAILVEPITGKFMGLRQRFGQEQVTLAPNKCFLYTYGGEPGELHGRSQHESIRRTYGRYEDVAQAFKRYLCKITKIIVQIHYPDGVSQLAGGAPYPNDWIAQQILDAIAEGHSVRFQNLFSSVDPHSNKDMAIAAALAGKSSWIVSAVDVGDKADHTDGMIKALSYWDKLLARGWMVAERAAFEAVKSGSRADAEQHSNTGDISKQVVANNVFRAIRRYVVNDVLLYNFGVQAVNSVWPEPDEITENRVAGAERFILAKMQNPTYSAFDAIVNLPDTVEIANLPLMPDYAAKLEDFNSIQRKILEQSAKPQPAPVLPAAEPTPASGNGNGQIHFHSVELAKKKNGKKNGALKLSSRVHRLNRLIEG